ncbi:DNA-directed RNA polymerase [Polychytrium aggregatum]|uniref:DNA-directed RNA polymerase n=1 Tax=Polychytrium aggregatum TaxID=110093 RepID=UPI0022FF2757|nr:DNA-directed RNA polymerase [Polychytrium aggregatum]KAI9204978.1 DNA-directed RNA polymerase [Polychytrium aggregatum]
MAPTDKDMDLIRSRVIIEKSRVDHVSSMEFPHNFPGEDLSWDLEKFKKSFKVVVTNMAKDDMEFDLIGVDAAIANAFRRIMIGEVPTMAIEKVYIFKNDTIMHDEILAHRLGLIPILADPRFFDFKMGDADPPTDMNTIVFDFNIACQVNPKSPPNAVNPEDKYIDSSALSRHLIWAPQGEQDVRFAETPIAPVHTDILLTKLRPGQEISLQAHCQKGIGKEHAKWSPVATASYRLLPEITILSPILNDDADKFRDCFPSGVIGIKKNADGVREAFVKNPRKDTVSREVLRHKEFENKVRLARVRDHFIFSVESTGVLKPNVIFIEAVQILIDKCKKVKESVAALQSHQMSA